LTAKISSRSVFVWRAIAITSIVGHILTIWFSSFGLVEKVSILYWHRFSAFFIFLRFLTFVIALIAIWFSSEPKVRDWMTFFAVIASCCILSFVNYTSLFISSFVNHVGTVELKGKIYQLATVEKFDDETNYYLGECDHTGYICKFHSVYGIYLTAIDDMPEIRLSENSLQLAIKINDEIIYTYNGIEEQCLDSDFGYCIVRTP